MTTVMLANYRLLNLTLDKTRNNLVEVCDMLEIDPSKVNPELLDVTSCCNCGVWGKNHTYEDGLPVCQFCNDIDSLRF